ncbi:MAG: CDP-alcohol phosphatidyltransferase family protein [Myxococcota bacterium]|nr:CDP-alcohol phosphatidyltransferase family protein [Myxococcota bacterium]
MIKEKFGENLERAIDSGLPILLKRPIDPNLLSVAGAAVCCASAVALGMGEFFLGSVLLGVGGLFDLIDGVVARHFGIATPFGAFLDSTLDRLVDMVVLLALVVHYALAENATMACVAGVVLVASVLTSYIKARGESMGISLPGGFVERGERIFVVAAGGFFGLMEPALWLLAIASVATVVQRFEGARRGLSHEAQDPEKESSGGEWVHEK